MLCSFVERELVGEAEDLQGLFQPGCCFVDLAAVLLHGNCTLQHYIDAFAGTTILNH